MLAVQYGKDTADWWLVKELFEIAKILHPQNRTKRFESYSPVNKRKLFAPPH